MSKYLNIQSGDYTVRVRDQGTITLDTGTTGTNSVDVTNLAITSPIGRVQVTVSSTAGLQDGSRVTLRFTSIEDAGGVSVDNVNGDFFVKFIDPINTPNIVELYNDAALLDPVIKDPNLFPQQQGSLDTIQGKVVVTGNLEVWGEQTIVNTTDLSIEDKIILLNRGESGPGIASGSGISGVEIDRGSKVNARIVFDETVKWTDPAIGGTTADGAWSLQDINGRILGLETISIATQGENLNLIGETPTGGSNGVITVYGTADYETNVTDDDHIPNKKYVDDFVAFYFLNNYTFRLEDGTNSISYIEIEDQERTSVFPTKIRIGIDGVDKIVVYNDYTDIHDLRISGNALETLNSNEDLVLQSNGTGSVRVNDNLLLDPTPHIGAGVSGTTIVDPLAPTEGVKLYSKTQGEGATNIYYVNETGRRDELVSKNRALLFSMLF